jgi:uncharacterized SAM-dependent methyltransferase
MTATVQIHASQFPARVRAELLAGLRQRRIPPKFHYDSVKQTLQWLALHQAHSPSRHDAECAAMYDRAFAFAAQQVNAPRAHLLGLGCGGGQKDTRLLRQLADAGHAVSYTPCDVSPAMTLVARETALAVVPPEACFPFVCDLAAADSPVPDLTATAPGEAARIITFFGMIPNFEPEVILPVLAAFVRPGDLLLFSANLAPGADYAAGVRQILPQYDNPLTRDWLLTFLLDLGVEQADGELRFGAEATPAGLWRVVADFHFVRPRRLALPEETFDFRPGDTVRLFFSYRYTPERVRAVLAQHGLAVQAEWLTPSGEEGVFAVRRHA